MGSSLSLILFIFYFITSDSPVVGNIESPGAAFRFLEFKVDLGKVMQVNCRCVCSMVIQPFSNIGIMSPGSRLKNELWGNVDGVRLYYF